jgi:hypothetical protein
VDSIINATISGERKQALGRELTSPPRRQKIEPVKFDVRGEGIRPSHTLSGRSKGETFIRASRIVNAQATLAGFATVILLI